MSWVEIERKRPLGAAARDGVAVSVSRKGTHFQRLIVSIHPRSLDKPPSFLVVGHTVSVHLGSGEHAGMVRITPGGPHRLSCMGGQSHVGQLVSLQVPLPASIVTDQQHRQSVEFDYADDWLEVTLPAWGKPRQPVVKAPFQTTATVGNGVRPLAGGR